MNDENQNPAIDNDERLNPEFWRADNRAAIERLNQIFAQWQLTAEQ